MKLEKIHVMLVTVTVNKMGELEEEYEEGIEREEELFIEGLKNNKSLTELEKQYSKKVKEIRKIYEKSLKKDLYASSEIKSIKKRENTEEKFKEFKAEGVALEKNKIEKAKIKLESANYKVRRKIKNFFDKIIPRKIIYLSHKIRINIKSINKDSKNMLKRLINKLSNSLNTIWTYVKDGFMKVISNIKRILSLFTKKKKQDKKEEDKKKEEIKIEDGNKE